jgi:exodeoxyribonuclease VII large subunit
MVQDQGLGALFLAFEALKKRLAALGYFDRERKRPLPSHALRAAVITAARSAALRDFLRLASERGFGASIRIHPVLVQGDKAPGQIVQAVHEINAQGWAEVIVLIRGGGSLEDLWAFNTEEVARAVFGSTIPVLTGLGHETDTTIADLVADMRAATPSHAAQLLWPERRILAQMVDDLESRLTQLMQRFLLRKAEALVAGEKALTWLSPRLRVSRTLEQLDALEKSLVRLGQDMIRRRAAEVLHPTLALTRAMGERYWQTPWLRLERAERDLGLALATAVRLSDQKLSSLARALAALDPLRPLEKGFCLVELPGTKGYLRDAVQVSPGDIVRIIPRQGQVSALVLNERDKAGTVCLP